MRGAEERSGYAGGAGQRHSPAGNIIDAAHGCTAVLDFGDGERQNLTNNNAVTHYYRTPGD